MNTMDNMWKKGKRKRIGGLYFQLKEGCKLPIHLDFRYMGQVELLKCDVDTRLQLHFIPFPCCVSIML